MFTLRSLTHNFYMTTVQVKYDSSYTTREETDTVNEINFFLLTSE